MDLGTTIKRLRKQQGQTQTEFAKSCDITQTYLSQIENNQKDPNLSVIERIGAQLNIPLPILFFLSLDNKDVPENKKQAFEIISPPLKSYLNELFSIQKE